jgi:hypothetical protein
MNRGLGARFLKGFVLRCEVAAYIEAHEQQGVHLDQDCQELHYDCGIYMLLMKRNGIWYITEIWKTNTPERFVPVYLWRRLRRGWQEWPMKEIIGWRALSADCFPGTEVID